MIAIDNKLVSDELIEEQFVCDLVKCKGGCCVDGDAGAPLDKSELKEINEIYEAVLPYLTEESKRELEKQGKYVYDKLKAPRYGAPRFFNIANNYYTFIPQNVRDNNPLIEINPGQ